MILDLTNLSVENKRILNNIYINTQTEFVDLLNELFIKVKSHENILLHPIFSRNIYHSSFYLDYCHLKLIQELETRISGVICPNRLVLQAITTNFRGLHVSLNKGVYPLRFFLIKGSINVIFKSLYFIYIRDSNRKKYSAQRNFTLIDTFLTQDSLRKNKFIDRNYPKLVSYLDSEDISRVLFMPNFLALPTRKKLAKISVNSVENIIIKYDYLLLADYIDILKNIFYLKKIRISDFTFNKIELSSYLSNSIKYTTFDSSLLDALINIKFAKRLAQANIAIGSLIEWNENQAPDKGLVFGFRRYLPKVKIKGYQGYIISPIYNWYIKPTPLEIANNLIPHTMCVMGNKIGFSLKEFSREVIVEVAPSFRFVDLFTDFEKKLNKDVLVILPIGFQESKNILSIVFQSGIQKKTNVLLRFHPLSNLVDLHAFFEDEFEEIEICDGELKKNILNTSITIGSSSSSLLESLVFFSPVIVVVHDVVNNPIPSFVDKDLYALVFDHNDLVRAYDRFATSSLLEKFRTKEISNSILVSCFSKPTKLNSKEFLFDNQ